VPVPSLLPQQLALRAGAQQDGQQLRIA